MPDDTDLLLPGPWQHRDVSANGVRFHVVEAGQGPLVLLLHGFPQFWWAWRHQITALADAGFRVAAPDLRGYGASDKPARGYDPYTFAADVAGLVRALGERDATVVGHDWGGVLGWTAATLHPQVVASLVVLSSAHPMRHREAMLKDPRGQLRASLHLLAAQRPWTAERALVRDDGAMVERLLRQWSGPGFPNAEAVRRYRDAIQVRHVSNTSLEYYRWLVRSQTRPSGIRYFKRMQQPVAAPTLQLHGALDTCVLPRTALGSGRYVEGTYEWRLVEGVGHFLPEESPELVSAEIVRWAKGG